MFCTRLAWTVGGINSTPDWAICCSFKWDFAITNDWQDAGSYLVYGVGAEHNRRPLSQFTMLLIVAQPTAMAPSGGAGSGTGCGGGGMGGG